MNQIHIQQDAAGRWVGMWKNRRVEGGTLDAVVTELKRVIPPAVWA